MILGDDIDAIDHCLFVAVDVVPGILVGVVSEWLLLNLLLLLLLLHGVARTAAGLASFVSIVEFPSLVRGDEFLFDPDGEDVLLVDHHIVDEVDVQD